MPSDPLPLSPAEEKLLRFSRSIDGIPVGWEPAPTVDRLLATLDAARLSRGADAETLRQRLADALRTGLIERPPDDSHQWCDEDGGGTHRFDTESWLSDVEAALSVPAPTLPALVPTEEERQHDPE